MYELNDNERTFLRSHEASLNTSRDNCSAIIADALHTVAKDAVNFQSVTVAITRNREKIGDTAEPIALFGLMMFKLGQLYHEQLYGE